MRLRHRAPERIGECIIDPSRISQMIERLRLVEAPHLDRPFHRLARTTDREVAVGSLRDHHYAPVYRGRVGAVDLYFGLAGGPAFRQRQIIKERKAHGALDLEGALRPRKSITACCEISAGLITFSSLRRLPTATNKSKVARICRLVILAVLQIVLPRVEAISAKQLVPM